MAKEFDAENAARQLIKHEALMGKASKANLLAIIFVLVDWLRGANKRAKAAEEVLHGQPIWERRFNDQKQVIAQLACERNAAEAKVEALKTEHREALIADSEKMQEYIAMTDFKLKDAEKQFDDYNRQLNEKDDEIKLLVDQLNAALEVVKAKNVVISASVEVADAKAAAAYAELKMVALGIPVKFSDEGDD